MSMRSSVETHARRTAMQDRDLQQLPRVLAMSSSVFLTSFALGIFSGRIPRESAPTLPGLGGDSELLQKLLATLCCPSDCEPVALAQTTAEKGCSCSVNYPTPCKRDYKGPSSKKWRERPGAKAFATLPDKLGGMPHPGFVEHLMGFPIGWSDLSGGAMPSMSESASTSGDKCSRH